MLGDSRPQTPLASMPPLLPPQPASSAPTTKNRSKPTRCTATLFLQQESHVGDDILGRRLESVGETVAAGRVHGKNARRVIDRVVAARVRLARFDEDAPIGGDGGYLFRRAGETGEGGVEAAGVGMGNLRRVPLWIDSDEQNLQPFVTHFLLHAAQVGHRQRADVGAKGVAEVDQDYLPGKVREGDRATAGAG